MSSSRVPFTAILKSGMESASTLNYSLSNVNAKFGRSSLTSLKIGNFFSLSVLSLSINALTLNQGWGFSTQSVLAIFKTLQ